MTIPSWVLEAKLAKEKAIADDYRRWLAGIVLAGLLSDPKTFLASTDENPVEVAVRYADALIAKLAGESDGGR